ncbi:MAG: UbiD family decarboxylase [Desulfuromusa sp.]|nr:UbiD family decarboxylase [Desulfuromusa sp.]
MDLREYLQRIDESGELRVIKTGVDPVLELAALCRREFGKPQGGQALLFEQITDSPFPVVANLLGSERRASQLLHSDSFVHFSGKLQKLLQQKIGTVAERLQFSTYVKDSFLSEETELQFAPDLKLTGLPAIQSWPKDGGRYLTLALTLTQHPETGLRNLGLYRAQIIDSDHLAVNFSPSSGAAEHLAAAAEAGKPLPISLVLGSDPALLWVAAAPLPRSCDEFVFHQALFDRKLFFTSGLSQPLAVPTDAEIVIEGQIIPEDTVTEGPFGNHTGQYVSRSDCPLMQVTAIRHRPKSIFSTTVVGPPPSENIYLARANEILLREMMKIDYPQICDLHMPLETIFHGVALLAVKPQSAADNKELLYELWRKSPLHSSRLLVLLDEDIDLSSASSSWWRTINCLKNQCIYQDNGRIAIDATGVDPASLVVEDRQTQDLLQRRRDEYKSC